MKINTHRIQHTLLEQEIVKIAEDEMLPFADAEWRKDKNFKFDERVLKFFAKNIAKVIYKKSNIRIPAEKGMTDFDEGRVDTSGDRAWRLQIGENLAKALEQVEMVKRDIQCDTNAGRTWRVEHLEAAQMFIKEAEKGLKE